MSVERRLPHTDSPDAAPQVARGFLRVIGPWLIVVVLALAVRLVYVGQIRSIPFVSTPVGDAASYDAWARRIADGDWLGNEVFYQAPAYPYFLAMVYRLIGSDPLVVRCVQACLGACSCLLVGLAASRFFCRRVGVTAGILLAVYPPAIFFDGLVQKTSLALVLMTALLWRLAVLGDCLRKRGGAGGDRCGGIRVSLVEWVVVGLLLGVFGLTRENALVLIVVVLAWLWIAFGGASIRSRLAWTGGFVVGLALTLGLVAYRNHHVGGVWAITTVQAGPNFYIGNHDGATGRYTPLVRGHESPPFERSDAKQLAQSATGRELSDGEVSRYWLGESAKFIREQPFAWVKLLGKKLLLAINAYEITDTEGFVVYRDYSTVLGVLSRFLHFGVLFPLACAGVALTWGDWRRLGLLLAVAAAILLSVVAFYVFARYRFPLVPVVVIFAAAALVEGARRWSDSAQSLGRAAVALIVAALVCNWPVNPERELDAMSYANLGTVLAMEGNVEGAAEVFAIAVAENPQAPELHYNLGLAFRLLGRPNAAIKHLSEAKRLSPNMIEVDFQLGQAYEAIGRNDLAVQHYRDALHVDPNDTEAAAAIARIRQ